MGWAIGFVAIAAAVSFLFVMVKNPPSREKGKPSKLERLGKIPDFALPNQDGKMISRESLEGRLCVVHFAHGSGTLERMAELRDRLVGARASDFTLITIATPPFPAPEQYGVHHPQSGNWEILFCPQEQVPDLINRGFLQSLSAEHPSQDADLSHFVVIDREGWIRSLPDGKNSAVVERILKDLADLFRESPIREGRP